MKVHKHIIQVFDSKLSAVLAFNTRCYVLVNEKYLTDQNDEVTCEKCLAIIKLQDAINAKQ